MKAYERYKDSCVAWLGKIPEHWKMRKIKRIFSERVEKGFPDEELLVASQNMGVVPKSIYGNRTVEAQKDLHLLKLVKVGDFVISLRSFQGGIEYAYYQGIISPAYTIMINNGLIESSYFKYLAKSQRFIELLKICVTGIREGQNIDYNKLKNNLIPVPPLSEQEAIAKFLDEKISKINKLISIRQQEISELRELKKAIINKAVTKGDWKRVRLKNIVKVSSGDAITKAEFDDNGKCPVYGGGEIIGYTRKYNISHDAIVIGRVGARCGCVTFIDTPTWATDNALIITTDSNYKYVYYLLNAANLNEMNLANAQPLITGTKVKNKIVRFTTDKAEQQHIADYLDKKCSQIDALITNHEKQITELNELKARLISDAVTGKIDVR